MPCLGSGSPSRETSGTMPPTLARRVRCETPRPWLLAFSAFGAETLLALGRRGGGDITRRADACADVTASSCRVFLISTGRVAYRYEWILSEPPAHQAQRAGWRRRGRGGDDARQASVLEARGDHRRRFFFSEGRGGFRSLLRSFFSLFSAFFRSFRFALSRIAAILASFRRVSSSANTRLYPQVLRASSGEKRAGFVRSGARRPCRA